VKIARRSSGGRGEYELAGELEGIRPADIFDVELVVGIGWLELETNVVVRDQGGKPRLRRVNSSGSYIQIPRQVAALLLMPASVREDVAMQSGLPVLREDAYAIDEIDVLALSSDPSRCRLQLGTISVKNQTASATVDPLLRLSRVRALWSNRHRFPSPVADALAGHRDAVLAGGPLTASVESAVRVITDSAEGDPLGPN
jgi:hypothetical protein